MAMSLNLAPGTVVLGSDGKASGRLSGLVKPASASGPGVCLEVAEVVWPDGWRTWPLTRALVVLGDGRLQISPRLGLAH